MDNAIEITGLTKRYRDFSLNDISLVIPLRFRIRSFLSNLVMAISSSHKVHDVFKAGLVHHHVAPESSLRLRDVGG